MKHTTIGLFPQPLTKIELNKDLCTLAADVFDKKIREEVEALKDDRYHGEQLKHFHNHENVFDLYSELQPLHDTLLEMADFVYCDVMNHEYGMRFTQAWYNECQVGGWQKAHSHCNCTLSGTLYLRTDENSILDFFNAGNTNENSPAILDEPSKKNNKFGYMFHANSVTAPVNTGDALFWPSHINHGYPDNKTPNRLSLSFNLMPIALNSLYGNIGVQ